MNRWWICTGFFHEGGQKVLGPFATQELALEVRGYMDPDGKHRYCIDEDES